MEEITNITNEAINRYFNSLSVFGYRSYNDVNKVIVLSFIEELLSGELSYFITEEDYRVIMDSIYCLAGSNCMIDYPSFSVYNSLIHKSASHLTSRITEDGILRTIETFLRDKA